MARLLGLFHFNQAAQRFILEHPPHGVDLRLAAQGFPQWLAGAGELEMPVPVPREALVQAADIDAAWSDVWMAPEVPAWVPNPDEAKVLENLAGDGGREDARYDSTRATALVARQDVYCEGLLEQLGPGDAVLGGRGRGGAGRRRANSETRAISRTTGLRSLTAALILHLLPVLPIPPPGYPASPKRGNGSASGPQEATSEANRMSAGRRSSHGPTSQKRSPPEGVTF